MQRPAAECLPGGKEVPLVKAVPRYLQIINYYQGMIDAGKLSEGQQMPTEEAIGALFSVSRITVRQALDGLAQAGYIYKVQGKGSFVASKKAGMQLNHLIGFSDEMRSLGLEPSTILMEQSLMLPTEAVAKALNIDVTQKIYFLTRIRCADGVPMCCFSERMRKLFRKNEKNVLRFCNKKAKEKRRLQRVKKPM